MHRTRHTLISLIATCAFTFVILVGPDAQNAHADAPPQSAKDLYTNGRISYNLGHYDDALKQFEAAYRVKQDPAFLFNIAQCMRNLDRYEDAARTYRAFLRETPGIDSSNRDQVQKLIVEMDNKAAGQNRRRDQDAAVPSPTEVPPAHAASTAEVAPPPAVDVATAPAHHDTPVYKKWWLWTGVGVVVAGAAIGLGIGLTQKGPSASSPTDLGTFHPSF